METESKSKYMVQVHSPSGRVFTGRGGGASLSELLFENFMSCSMQPPCAIKPALVNVLLIENFTTCTDGLNWPCTQRMKGGLVLTVHTCLN